VLIAELDIFILSQGHADALKNFPYNFWTPQLEKFVAGGGCPMPYLDPDPMVPAGACPAASAGMPIYSWVPGGEMAGCECTNAAPTVAAVVPHCNARPCLYVVSREPRRVSVQRGLCQERV
jgi:hypothetical protein